MVTAISGDARMARLAQGIRQCLGAFGLNPVVTARSILGVPRFFRNMIDYQKLRPPVTFRLSLANLFPTLSEFNGQAGTARGHYFHQDLWAARKIYSRRPASHYDVGSRIDGFVAHLLTFMEVHVIDVLPLNSTVKGLYFIQGDGVSSLNTNRKEGIPSLSCLHAAEHFGLGRYSDPVDPFAHEKLMAELESALVPGGFLYFSVPIGRERLMYNSHRIFSVPTILRQFAGLTLRSFSYVDDAGDLHENACATELSSDLRYGCGLFEFCKD